MMWESAKAANFTHGDVYMCGAVTAVVLVGTGRPLRSPPPRGDCSWRRRSAR
jgi:branched-subunit amino acid ABC-type transport system permease component